MVISPVFYKENTKTLNRQSFEPAMPNYVFLSKKKSLLKKKVLLTVSKTC